MPPLIARWNVLADGDKGLFPLLECFTSIAQVAPGRIGVASGSHRAVWSPMGHTGSHGVPWVTR
eukprot:1981008-Prymnesium_polylepis.1